MNKAEAFFETVSNLNFDTELTVLVEFLSDVNGPEWLNFEEVNSMKSSPIAIIQTADLEKNTFSLKLLFWALNVLSYYNFYISKSHLSFFAQDFLYSEYLTEYHYTSDDKLSVSSST